jgi:hypothetical protein
LITSCQNQKLSLLACFFYRKPISAHEHIKPAKQAQQDQQESKYMNRVNRDRLYHLISSSSVGQGGFLFVNVGELFRNQQCLSREKSKKRHLEQMEWDFGGLLVLFDKYDAQTVSRKIISLKNQNVLGDG